MRHWKRLGTDSNMKKPITTVNELLREADVQIVNDKGDRELIGFLDGKYRVNAKVPYGKSILRETVVLYYGISEELAVQAFLSE